MAKDQARENGMPLGAYLAAWAGHEPLRGAIAETILSLSETCIEIAALIARGALVGDLAQERRGAGGGDVQKKLDIVSHELVEAALRRCPVAYFASEESEAAVSLAADAPLCVAVDPLDGSSNIDTNISVGTIFSILPVPPAGAGRDPAPEKMFMQPGTRQLAAGFAFYGPQTLFVLTLGAGVVHFAMDPESRAFVHVDHAVNVPRSTKEFAINMSNARHWDEAARAYVEDCLAGCEGPREKDYNMRWVAALVADAYRIMARGGVYLYPGDQRLGYADGRIRLIYEANPISLLIEQAGGRSTTGSARVLELVPTTLHQRVPLIFGSEEEVVCYERLARQPRETGDRASLFGKRGLFRA